jgi:hypothetical protein
MHHTLSHLFQKKRSQYTDWRESDIMTPTFSFLSGDKNAHAPLRKTTNAFSHAHTAASLKNKGHRLETHTHTTDELQTLRQGREISRLAPFMRMKVIRVTENHRSDNGLFIQPKPEESSIAWG